MHTTMGTPRRLRAAAIVAALACGLAGPAVLAGTSVVLTDGQVIKGTDVRREGDSYLVTMPGGSIVPFPAQLVKEVRLEDDAPAKPPPGFDTSGPRQLAGPVLPSQDPGDQLAVFGPPSKWSKDVVDTTWVPTSAYDPSKDVLAGSRTKWAENAVDTTWVPTSAYDPSKDVLEGSRSKWSKDAIDTTWQPTDGFGFKPLSSKASSTVTRYPMTFTAPAPIGTARAAAGPSPWSCGEAIFAKDHDAATSAKKASAITVHAVKEPKYTALGLPLYSAEAKVDGEKQIAIFSTAGGQCRLIGGDAGAILGMNLTPDHTMAQDAASFNAAMATRGGAKVRPGGDPLEFALAFLSVTDPRISGSPAATLKIVATPDDLKRIAANTATGCAEGKSKKRKEARAANSSFSLPKIVASHEGDVATFLTWSSAGGTLCRNTVVLSRDGVVSARREVLASHVGTHTD